MDITKKMILETRFYKAIQSGSEYIAVAISFLDQEDFEIIINTRSNFESKLKYYQSSYDDDLTLKVCKDICISSVVMFSGEKTIDEVKEMLEEFKI